MMDLPKSKSEARQLGAVKYWTGRPCSKGHYAPRYTVNGACCECTAESKAIRKASDPEAWKLKTKMERERAKERDPERARRHTREWMRRWRRENREISNDRMRKWRRENPEKSRQSNANNRANRKKAEGTFSASDVSRLLLAQGKKCAECKCRLSSTEYHVDHIMPLSKGGTNWPTNLQILCASCNLQKHAKDPFEWAKLKGRLL
jgi:5-methylcytosine-specific restriction endonuclease McrA